MHQVICVLCAMEWTFRILFFGKMGMMVLFLIMLDTLIAEIILLPMSTSTLKWTINLVCIFLLLFRIFICLLKQMFDTKHSTKITT